MADLIEHSAGQLPLTVKAVRARRRSALRDRAEYVVLRIVVSLLGALPRSVARTVGRGIGAFAALLLPRLRHVARVNLTIAYPSSSKQERERIRRESFGSLGVQLAEFCRMARLTRASAERLFRYDGLEHFEAAEKRGRGVLVLTAHLGHWELSSFLHSLMGHPMGMIIRRLDNPLIDHYVNRIRCLHGNRAFHKDDFARGLLSEMRAGRTVGILMDTNMRPPQGVFVPFFGKAACTASGVARVAQRTGAAVLPGFLVWEREEQRYVLRFGRELDMLRTGDTEGDALINTARFTEVLEAMVRRYPEQWLWMHRRWKTRPAGELEVY